MAAGPPSPAWRALSGYDRPERFCSHRHGTRQPPECATAVARGHDRVRARSLTGGGTRWWAGAGAGAARSGVRGRGAAGWTVTGGAPGRTATRSRAGFRMSMTGRGAVDTRAACAVSGGDHRCLTARSHPCRQPVLASGAGTSHGPRRVICCWLPAWQEDGWPAMCAQACGSLVQNGTEPVRARWKCWGSRHPAALIRGSLTGRTRPAPCAFRRNGNCPHPAPRKLINRPNIDRTFIRL